MMSQLLRTPLYDWHVAHGGRMVEFGGWEMPIQYASIVDEHHAVRRAAGLFDISHMGRVLIQGPDALSFVDHLVTCDVASMKPWQIRYGLMCREDGGILDDVLVYKDGGTSGNESGACGLVVNASNRLKILDWLNAQKSGFDCQIADRTLDWYMIALQGPRALEVLEQFARRLGPQPLRELKYYWSSIVQFENSSEMVATITRTGYTGEDGFELLCGEKTLRFAWDKILEIGGPLGVIPCGLGARDTLRLEAAMPLYGHELSESIDPITAGLEFAAKLNKPDFIGKAALAAIAQRTDRQVRVGLKLDGRRIAREGTAVLSEDEPIGTVTSGTFSPTLEQSIAMAYVAPQCAVVGTSLTVDIRGKRESATVVPLPFYRRPK